MTEDIRHWLAEIKGLQQKLSELQQERDQAYASAANWRTLYETEARQRRQEAQQASQHIQELRADVKHLQTEIQQAHWSSAKVNDEMSILPSVCQQIDELPYDRLKETLIEILIERDRIQQTLEAEREAHEETRKSLTSALGDTVDILTKERVLHAQKSNALSL
jgi:chromosome segregation ATPase